MRIFVFILTLAMAAPMLWAPAFAQSRSRGTVPSSYPVVYTPYQANMARVENAPWRSLSRDEKAARMNRDYDYLSAPSSSATIKVPLTRQQKMRLYRNEIRRREAAEVNFKAMTADQRRAFLQRNSAAFNAGYNPRPIYR